MSTVVKETIRILGSKHSITSIYHPQTNGLVERVNGILINMISKLVDKNQSNWSSLVKYMTFAYNTSVHTGTGFSPFYLVYGSEPNLPGEMSFGTGIDECEFYVQEVHISLKKAREIVSERIKNSQENSKLAYDKKHRQVEFKLGDNVLVHYPLRKKGLSTKLLHKYLGPYTIIEKRGPVTYIVQSIQKPDNQVLVHV